ncbi:MAG: hypothetical protein LUO94_13705, partial [Methylococcaceae bacterium]|nr:hypothetical protein [Methylococcaceae bacterium]
TRQSSDATKQLPLKKFADLYFVTKIRLFIPKKKCYARTTKAQNSKRIKVSGFIKHLRWVMIFLCAFCVFGMSSGLYVQAVIFAQLQLKPT